VIILSTELAGFQQRDFDSRGQEDRDEDPYLFAETAMRRLGSAAVRGWDGMAMKKSLLHV